MSTSFFELPITYALNLKQELRHIDEVPNGLACGCVCPSCGQSLIARNGGEKRMHHFAHKTNQCKWATEGVITMLAKQAIERHGAMHFPVLIYRDHVNRRDNVLSASRKLRVTSVQEVAVEGRQTPALQVTCQAGNAEATFAVCIVLGHGLKEDQADWLYANTDGVVLVDLKSDKQLQILEQGRHYSREELAEYYQNPEYIEEVMVNGVDHVMSWKRNRTRDAKETASHEEAEEIERKRQEEAAERARLEAERRQRYLEERRKREEEERAAKAAREARDGAIGPIKHRVTRFISYDVRDWEREVVPAGVLQANEICMRNGSLLAVIRKQDEFDELVLNIDFNIDALTEVGQHLEELCAGFESYVLHLSSKKLEERLRASVVDETSEAIALKLSGPGSREISLALRWLDYRIPMQITTKGYGFGWVDVVDVDAGMVTLSRHC